MTDRKEKHYQRIITLSWDHPRYGYRLFQLRCVRSRVQMILAIPFLHGCSALSGPDDRGGGDNEMRAVSINRHAEFFPVLDQEAEEIIDDVCKCRYENFTVGGVISKSNMKYGYAEIRSRATPVTVSSAFWVIGNHRWWEKHEMAPMARVTPRHASCRPHYTNGILVA